MKRDLEDASGDAVVNEIEAKSQSICSHPQWERSTDGGDYCLVCGRRKRFISYYESLGNT